MSSWIKSSFCHSGGCVEVTSDGRGVLVRDSKDPHGPVLRFTADEWEAFLLGADAGEFDLPEVSA